MKGRIVLCVTILILLAASAPLVPQSSDEREFVGTINRTLKVRIRLARSGTRLSGSYAYDRVGKSLRLDGEMTSAKEFSLNEFDERHHQTGKFQGQFVSKDWLEGTWSSTGTKTEMAFSAWAIDGKQVPAESPEDRVSGEYRRVDQSGRRDRHSAELHVWLLKDGQVRVSGYASWVGNARTGNVNVGSTDGICERQGSKVLFKASDGDDGCRFTITLGVESLVVGEDNLKCGGLNVSYDGKYARVTPKRHP